MSHPAPGHLARHPSLHTLPANPGEPPALLATRCAACGRTLFPPREYGCEACGAGPDQLERVELAGRGEIEAVAVVHRGFSPDPPAPYSVAQIRLEEGFVIEALLADCDPAQLRTGQPVRTTLVATATDDAGRALVECRFTPAE
jgi:uncharacterized protein